MRKNWIILVNFLLIAGILAFVIVYTSSQSSAAFRERIGDFQNVTVAMEKVTENYLEGEQNICDVWARYIITEDMTMEEAVSFVRSSHVMQDAAAHILYMDDGTIQGLSTRPRAGTEADYAVSYAGLGLLEGLEKTEVGERINITRAYTNPLNGTQSIAFYNWITLYDGEMGGPREGILLRVVPISGMERKWIFPQEEYQDAEFSVLDADEGYIIQSSAFSGHDFFTYYREYNETDEAGLEKLRRSLAAGTGSFTMFNSQGQECLLVHTPILSTEGWQLVSYLPMAELRRSTVDWLLIVAISVGLLLLFGLDLAYLLHFNQQLQQTAREAETANRAKTDFLSTMSHDIRTPMNAIIGLTAIAEKNVNDPTAVGENLRKISLAGNHLLTLINDILDISKVESGKLTLSPVTFSLVETVENLVNFSQPMVKEKNLDFSFRVHGLEKEYLYADQLRLNQIYINLLSNALKYTEPGGSVSVDLAEEASETPGAVRLICTVADTGIGMSPEYMEKMYQPFSRQTDSRVNTIQGTGLGLTITKQMVSLMGGDIQCSSRQGEGTTFRVELNIPAAEKQPESLRLEGVSVLIVDDDEVLRETAADTLRSMGAEPDTAPGGAEALEMILRRRDGGREYGAVVVDWKMPGMDGVETVRSIRESVGRELPILLISAYDWSDIEEAARAAGADGFIGKPLFRSTFYDRLSSLLGMQTAALEPEEDDGDVRGMRVLVAEDNDINWEIISTLLEMHGVAAERAENGRLCVDRLRASEKGSFDLVFMDIQMPVMNGLDATRAIRALEGCWASAVPIVAMTADAFSENVAECMAAGMNGHIAKPIDVKLVMKELRRVRENAEKK